MQFSLVKKKKKKSRMGFSKIEMCLNYNSLGFVPALQQLNTQICHAVLHTF